MCIDFILIYILYTVNFPHINFMYINILYKKYLNLNTNLNRVYKLLLINFGSTNFKCTKFRYINVRCVNLMCTKFRCINLLKHESTYGVKKKKKEIMWGEGPIAPSDRSLVRIYGCWYCRVRRFSLQSFYPLST
jgi:hypothetical protein